MYRCNVKNETEDCGKVYVGTTKRILSITVGEHVAAVKGGKEWRALSQHLMKKKHTADLRTFEY